MKMAVSGAHRTGKTVLIDELVNSLPTINRFEEPYYQLESEGYPFAEMPSVGDFERQLECSIELITESEATGRDCIFDRCPYDLVAYLMTHEDDSDAFDLMGWFPRIQHAVQQLNLVVFVPIETPDRVTVSDADDWTLRRRIDEELQGIVLEDRWSLGVPTIRVSGSPGDRARQVLAQIAGSSAPG